MELNSPRPTTQTQGQPVAAGANKGLTTDLTDAKASLGPAEVPPPPVQAAATAVSLAGDAPRAMTYGDGQAIKILVAEQMGMEPACVDLARRLLQGLAVHPMDGAAIDREGARVHGIMASEASLVEKANIHAQIIAKEYGLAVPGQSTQQDSWEPSYSPWRHGGWYVNNVRYPSGAIGCVSNNYEDRKWRIACDPRPFEERPTFKTRDAAARAEKKYVEENWDALVKRDEELRTKRDEIYRNTKTPLGQNTN